MTNVRGRPNDADRRYTTSFVTNVAYFSWSVLPSLSSDCFRRNFSWSPTKKWKQKLKERKKCKEGREPVGGRKRVSRRGCCRQSHGLSLLCTPCNDFWRAMFSAFKCVSFSAVFPSGTSSPPCPFPAFLSSDSHSPETWTLLRRTELNF